ncbi:MAG: PIN domain protein [Deltaproteobacteria bacterium]|nr:PIN domain protein [Deltaproteobacteria bacterium]
MKRLLVYADASVIGGCEDLEFQAASNALWNLFVEGRHLLALSVHTLRELQGAPESVRSHLLLVPEEHQILFSDSRESFELADAYLHRGVLGPGSRADALHVALATTGGADVIVSWNYKHIVNLRRIRLFNSVNLEWGYNPVEIRTPQEVLQYDEAI